MEQVGDPGTTQPARAGEPVTVIHEPTVVVHEPVAVVHDGTIPWAKVSRNEALHLDGMELAEKFGCIDGALKVYAVVGAELAKEDQEIFLVLPLNLRGELKYRPFEVARGQRSSEVVGVDDVMRVVILSGCEGFVVVHNHPSGDPHPSAADRDLTRQIADATKPFGKSIKFIDHVVVGSGSCYSIVGKEKFHVKPPEAEVKPKRARKKR